MEWNHLVNNSLVIGTVRVTGEQDGDVRRLRFATRTRPPILSGWALLWRESAGESGRSPTWAATEGHEAMVGQRTLHKPLSLLLLTPLCLLHPGALGE